MKQIYFILFPILLLFSACSSVEDVSAPVLSDVSTPVMPADFEFSLTYGTYGKQKVDTFNDMIIKDLVIDGTIEAEIPLTVEEKNLTYNEMLKINIMGDLEIDRELQCAIEPPTFTSWHIQMNGQTKEFSYTSFCEYNGDAKNLMSLENYIHKLVAAKEEYQELPDSNGWYE
ncbi:hypothetical protein [Sutcliffiella horikoshii]|uniref:Lipoprotein n=1 Tax=Sutcliffiella horikoshii TaxID=79883 RepID=A0A5D4TIW0_9BACI|nr:hypothetical protein [Sutcliffiella horikoshii]TYS74402.1 hypothetical protein FZC75_01490 [Sutcliffiella horikoshii]